MNIVRADKLEMARWSLLWMNQGNSFIRPMDAAYFERKYFSSQDMEAYSIREDDKSIGYFGVKRTVSDGVTSVSFCDFILDSALQSKGHFTKIVRKIREELFVSEDVLIFYPIHRNAMLSWKFALHPSIVEKLNRWIIALHQTKEEEQPDEMFKGMRISAQQVNDSQCGRMQMKIYKGEESVSNIIANEIIWNQKKGLEVFRMEGLQEVKILETLLDYSIKNEYEFLLIKLSENSAWNRWIESETTYRKEKEVLYKFLVCNPDKVEAIKNWNPLTIGEELDVPREDTLLQKLF